MTASPPSTGTVDAPFGDGVHAFRMDIKGLRELQDKTDAGPAYLLARIAAGQWRIDDLRETIRIGLVRGGLEPVKAMVLMELYFDNAPKVRFVPLACLILQAALFEPEAVDTPGKAPAEGMSAAASPSPFFSAAAQPGDSPPPRPAP